MSSSPDKRPLVPLPGVLFAFLVVFLLLRYSSGCQLAPPSLSVEEGEILELKGLNTLGGDPVSVADWKGNVVVLNFWATWCPPCVRELPNLINLREKTRDRNILVYCVSDEPLPKQTAFIERTGHPSDLFLTSDVDVSLYVGSAIPVTLILDTEGKVRSSHLGAAEWDADPVVELLTELATPTSASAAASLPAPVSAPVD